MASSVNVDPGSIASSISFLLAGSTIKSYLDGFLCLMPIPIVSGVCIFFCIMESIIYYACRINFCVNILIQVATSGVSSIFTISVDISTTVSAFLFVFCCFFTLLSTDMQTCHIFVYYHLCFAYHHLQGSYPY